MKYVSGKTGGTWKCTAKCKELTQFEVDSVLEFKSYFEKSLRDIKCMNGLMTALYILKYRV